VAKYEYSPDELAFHQGFSACKRKSKNKKGKKTKKFQKKLDKFEML